jgi:hypothetical protein
MIILNCSLRTWNVHCKIHDGTEQSTEEQEMGKIKILF